MKAWVVTGSPEAPLVLVGNAPMPAMGPGELLIRVQAAGVTPSELGWYPTTHHKDGSKREKAIPVHEFAGIVEGVGAGVAGVAAGDEVFGMNDWFGEGALAEYCTAFPHEVVQKPKSLTFPEAASVPISALTAWQGLYDRAKVRRGERVLIHGGAGAVGLYAVQLARLQQARVITTASERNREFLLQLGADEVIDYHTEDFVALAGQVDVVFDTVGGETLRRSWDLAGPGGRVVTVASDPDNQRDERSKNAFFIVEPNGDQLSRIAGLLDRGVLQSVVDAIVPCKQADKAYLGQIKPRLGRGKMVILAESVEWDVDEPQTGGV